MLVSDRNAVLLLACMLVGCSTQTNPRALGNSASTSPGSSSSGSGSSGSSGGSGSGSPAACLGGGSASAAAYVYVSVGTGTQIQITGYSAASSGSLTPFNGPAFSLAAFPTVGAGSLLFGTDGNNLDSFGVETGGCLRLNNSFAINLPDTPNGPSTPATLWIEPRNNNLYLSDYTSPDGLSPEFSSFSFNASTGVVTQIGASITGGDNLAVAANNEYALGTYCNTRGGTYITEYQQGSDGALSSMRNVPFPAVEQQYLPLCPGGVAADNSNHFVVEVTPFQYGGAAPGPSQLAIYTVDGSGNLTTASTSQNMVANDIGQATYQFSPDYHYLAALAAEGIEVFAWNSSSLTLTPLATLPSDYTCWQNSTGSGCGGTAFGNIAWDQNDHLYTTFTNQLLVYSVTSSGVTPAPGSPWSVPNANQVTVLPVSGN